MDRVLAQFFTAGQPLDSHLLGGANCWCGDARPWRMVHRRSPFRKKALQDARSQSGYEAIPLERDQTRNHLGTRLSSIWGRHPVGLPPQSGTEESDLAKCLEVVFIQVHVRRDCHRAAAEGAGNLPVSAQTPISLNEEKTMAILD